MKPGDIVNTFWRRTTPHRVLDVRDWHGAAGGQMLRLDKATHPGPEWIDSKMARLVR